MPVAVQSVLGRAVDGSSGAPVEGVLIDSIGQNPRETLTDSTGWFFLRPDGSGTYSVRGSALGYARIASDPLSRSPYCSRLGCRARSSAGRSVPSARPEFSEKAHEPDCQTGHNHSPPRGPFQRPERRYVARRV